MKIAAVVIVQEEVINGQRLLYQNRPELQSRVDGDDRTAMRRGVTSSLQEKGYEVTSCNFVGPQKIVAVVRKPKTTEPQSPLLYRPNPLPLKVTAAGRVRR